MKHLHIFNHMQTTRPSHPNPPAGYTHEHTHTHIRAHTQTLLTINPVFSAGFPPLPLPLPNMMLLFLDFGWR